MPRASSRLAFLIAATAVGVVGAASQTLTNPDPKPVRSLPVPAKSQAQENAKACPAFGTGFVQLPGTAACVKIGGSVTTDVSGAR